MIPLLLPLPPLALAIYIALGGSYAEGLTLDQTVLIVVGLSVYTFLGWLALHRTPDAPDFSNEVATLEAQLQRALTSLRISDQQIGAVVEDNSKLREQLEHRIISSAPGSSDTILDLLFATSGDALVLTDAEGRIARITTPATSLSGIHSLDCLSRRFSDAFELLTPGEGDAEPQPVHDLDPNLLHPGASRTQQVLVKHKTGALTPAIMSVAALRTGPDISGTLIQFEFDHASTGHDDAVLRDSLTGLLTRGVLERRLGSVLLYARKHMSTHQLLFFAPNNLDFITDHYGFMAGEQLLWRVASTAAAATLEDGECFRVAASRFAVLMVDASAQAAEDLGMRILDALAVTTLSSGTETYAVPASLAVLTLDAESPSIQVILDQAEEMLRSARRRGLTAPYTQPPEVEVGGGRDDQTWLAWLQGRLDDGLARLLSQEMRPVEKGRESMAECYIRIEDNDGVWLSPKDYLPALRRAGNTSLIDLWMIDELQELATQDVTISARYSLVNLNLSAESLTEVGFLDRVLDRLRESRKLCKLLGFEIQENTFHRHAREVLEFIEHVTKFGVRITIDQCQGFGFRDVIKEARPHFVKLDMSLIRQLDDALVVEQLHWMISSAAMNKIGVIAAGVEREDAIKRLKDLGVDYVQGDAINQIGALVS